MDAGASALVLERQWRRRFAAVHVRRALKCGATRHGESKRQNNEAEEAHRFSDGVTHNEVGKRLAEGQSA